MNESTFEERLIADLRAEIERLKKNLRFQRSLAENSETTATQVRTTAERDKKIFVQAFKGANERAEKAEARVMELEDAARWRKTSEERPGETQLIEAHHAGPDGAEIRLTIGRYIKPEFEEEWRPFTPPEEEA